MRKLGKDLVVGDTLVLWCGIRRIASIEDYNPPPALEGVWKEGARIAEWISGEGRRSGITIPNDDWFDVG